MKFSTQLLSPLLSIAFLILSQTAIANSDTVKLKQAGSYYYSGGGFSGRALSFVVKVKNIAPSKRVFIHYEKRQGQWEDLELSFSGHYGNYDVFNHNGTGSAISGAVRFAIRYEVNGQTYWDNNDGLNYYLPASDLTIIGENVVLNKMEAGGYHCAGYQGCSHATNLSGEIYVKKNVFGGAADVGVRCSHDGVNWRDYDANFSRQFSSGGVEIWTFAGWDYATINGGDFPQYQCAAYYGSSWDNNFGQDYLIQAFGRNLLR